MSLSSRLKKLEQLSGTRLSDNTLAPDIIYVFFDDLPKGSTMKTVYDNYPLDQINWVLNTTLEEKLHQAGCI